MTEITQKERRDREFDGGSSDRGVKSGEIIGLGGRGELFLRASRDGRFLETVGSAELLAEAFHAPGGIDELLFAGEERVAIRADIDGDLRKRAAGFERVSAGAVNGAELIFRMRFGLHGWLLNQLYAPYGAGFGSHEGRRM